MKKKDQILLAEAYQQVQEYASKVGNVGEHGAREYADWERKTQSANSDEKRKAEGVLSRFTSNLNPKGTGPRNWKGEIFKVEGNKISGYTSIYGDPKLFGSIDISKATDEEIKKFIERAFDEELSTSRIDTVESKNARKVLPMDKLINWMKSFKPEVKKEPTFQERTAKLKADQEAKRKNQQSGFQKIMGKLGFGK